MWDMMPRFCYRDIICPERKTMLHVVWHLMHPIEPRATARLRIVVHEARDLMRPRRPKAQEQIFVVLHCAEDGTSAKCTSELRESLRMYLHLNVS